MVDVVKQGMLFFIADQSSDANVVFKGEHTPQKRRLWVVVSNNVCNRFSPEISMCPIYTRPQATQPTQVYYKNADGRDQVVCCESVRTIPKSCIDTRGYMGMVSDDIMYKIRDALSVQFSVCEPDLVQTSSTLIEGAVDKLLDKIDMKEIVLQKICEMLTGNTAPTPAPQPIPAVPSPEPVTAPVKEPKPVTTPETTTAETKITLGTIVSRKPEIEKEPVKPEIKTKTVKPKSTDKPVKRSNVSGNKHIPDDRAMEFYLDSKNLSLEEMYEKWKDYGVTMNPLYLPKKRYSVRIRLQKLGLLPSDHTDKR